MFGIGWFDIVIIAVVFCSLCGARGDRAICGSQDAALARITPRSEMSMATRTPRSARRNPVGPTEASRRPLIVAAAIVSCLLLAIAVIYGRAIGFGFLAYDDSAFVLDNPAVRGGLTGHGIAWAFTGGPFGEWYPLAMLSHMLDCQSVRVERPLASLDKRAVARGDGRRIVSGLVAHERRAVDQRALSRCSLPSIRSASKAWSGLPSDETF